MTVGAFSCAKEALELQKLFDILAFNLQDVN